jgi:hypothetical protein
MPYVRPSRPSGLAIRALIGFAATFAAARTFTTLYPEVVVKSGGIHFHHFWYGLAIILAAGWLGIASNRPQLDRIYAMAFGVGSGLVGDEVGLLLTFGDYHSLLTYEFFVSALALASIGLLVAKYSSELEEDLLSSGKGERLIAIGIVTLTVAGLPAATGELLGFWVAFGIGATLILLGAVIHWKYLSR